MPIPGWYDDPERPGWVRRWDGSKWVDEWARAPDTSSPVHPSARRSGRRRIVTGASLLGAFAVGAAGIGWLVFDGLETGGSTTEDTSLLDDPAAPGGSPADGGPENEASRLEDCGRSDVLTIPGTDVSIEPLTREQERSIGADTRSMVFELYRRSDDADTQALLERLLDDVRPDDPDVEFNVTLLESGEVNAFAIAGGDLFFTTGITTLLADDELAFVMGHEVAHVVCRHLAQQFEREALVMAGLDALLGAEVDTERLYAEAAASVLNDVADLQFSRADELESDIVALDLLAEAGRPLSAGSSALRALRELEGTVDPSAVDIFFSTHPPTSERIGQLEEEIAER